jgi:hypothetical protein
MSATVQLNDIVEALESQFEEVSSYLDPVREDLLTSIHGAKAFRRFKDTVHRLNIETEWFAFRMEALRQIAIEWCKDNQIVCSADSSNATSI